MTPEEVEAEVKATVEAGKTTLNLAGKDIDDAGAATVCDLLKDDTTITDLWLYKNGLTDAAAASVRRLLETNKTIEKVRLARNGLTDAGAEELAAGIRANKEAGGAVKDVIFTDNKLTDKGQTLMAEVFHEAKIESGSGFLTDKFKATIAALQKRDAEESDTLTKIMARIIAEVKKKGYLQVAIDYRNHIYSLVVVEHEEAKGAKVMTVFAEAQAHANAENVKLGKLIVEAIRAYAEATIRWRVVMGISKTMEPPQQRALAGLKSEDKASKLKALLSVAQHIDGPFRVQIAALVDEFNGVDSTPALVAALGLSMEFMMEATGLSSETYEEMLKLELRDPKLAVVPAEKQILVILKFGPLKSFERAMEKDLDWLMDLNRVTAQFQNALALGLFYGALCKRFKVVGMKNLHDPNVNKDWKTGESYTRPPCIHLWIDMGDGFLVEVMLMLTAFIEIKKAQHKPYEIARAKHPTDMLASWDLARGGGVPDVYPVLARGGSDVEQLEAEVARLKAKNAQKDAENAALQAENAALKGFPQGGPRPPQKPDEQR